MHFARAEEWTYPLNPKLIFRDKNRIFGADSMRKFKKNSPNIIRKYFALGQGLTKGISVLYLNGELENLMFQHAFYWVRRKKGEDIRLHKLVCDESSNIDELERLFGIRASVDRKIHFIFRMLQKSCKWPVCNTFFKLLGLRLYVDADTLSYNENNYKFKCSSGLSIFYGKWNDEYHFEEYRTNIIRNFSFDQGLLSQRSKEILNHINNSESVSVLIEKEIHQTEFYTQAIERISRQISNSRLFLFIDNPDWSEANFDVENVEIIDFNFGADRWMNLFLMTQCKHNIYYESLFGWWGAWLNEHENKIVIRKTK